MIYIGYLVILVGFGVGLAVEGFDFTVFVHLSGILIVLITALGAVLVIHSPRAIFAAKTAVFRKKISKKELKAAIPVLGDLSRFTMWGGWLAFLCGLIIVSAAVGEASTDVLFKGLGVVLTGPVMGTFLSIFMFEPMKRNLEQKI